MKVREARASQTVIEQSVCPPPQPECVISPHKCRCDVDRHSFFVTCLVFCELNLFLSLLSSFFFCFCFPPCVCLVCASCFLTVVDPLLYGRWIAHVDTLCAPDRAEGGVSWNESRLLFLINFL